MSQQVSNVLERSVEKNMLFDVREANKSQFRKCNEFIEKSAESSVYHLTDWCELIADVFGHKYYYYS